MNGADKERVEQFLGSWLGTGGNEQANYQGFFRDLCAALSVEGPPPKAQLAAIRDLLLTTPGEWSTKQIVAQFKGNITQKKLEAITENLGRLEWFGLIIREDKGPIPHWHYAESTQAA
jgi:hypothetical protein